MLATVKPDHSAISICGRVSTQACLDKVKEGGGD